MSAYIELIFPVTLLAAATSDIVRYEIPNGLPIALLVGFLAYALASDRSVIDIGASLACGFLVLAVGATLFRLNWLGGGDVKLLAAATPWVGWAELPAFMIWVAIWGGALALVLLIGRRLDWVNSVISMKWWRRLWSNNSGIPYAVAICAGGLSIMGDIMKSEGIW